MNTVYQGQTYRLKLGVYDANDAPVDLSGASGEVRISFKGRTIETTAAVIDGPSGDIVVTIDRTVTETWRVGTYGVQVWLDYGEGAEIEEEVVYASEFSVERSYR